MLLAKVDVLNQNQTFLFLKNVYLRTFLNQLATFLRETFKSFVSQNKYLFNFDRHRILFVLGHEISRKNSVRNRTLFGISHIARTARVNPLNQRIKYEIQKIYWYKFTIKFLNKRLAFKIRRLPPTSK